MYFIAKDQQLLVVERVTALVQEEYPRDRMGMEIQPALPITLDSDVEVMQDGSDVEVLNPTTYRQLRDQPNILYTDVEVLNPTTYRQSRDQPNISYTMAPHPSIPVPIAYPPVLLGTHSGTIPCHKVERIVKLDKYSASSALEKADLIMSTKKNRCSMLEKASIMEINLFRAACKEVLNMVELRCRGIRTTKLSPAMPVADVAVLGRMEMDGLLARWQDEGCKFLKRTITLLNDAKHQKQFVEGSSVESIEVFKKKSFAIIGMVENTCSGMKTRVQIR
ncbi:hypothetical protein PtB15_18B115 [Puccinia triticina]|nr:hypothetical protein PtB15_18B115 [Puccinia triticina]